MQELLDWLKSQFPALQFIEGESCFWSPVNQTVTYKLESMRPEISQWSILHEVGHADLGHNTYKSDFELVTLEVAAWQRARQIAKGFNLNIDPEHVEDCLDTYRNWLHRRSTCPDCGTVSLQDSPQQYTCFNCQCTWYVSASRFCRPYRKVHRLGVNGLNLTIA